MQETGINWVGVAILAVIAGPFLWQVLCRKVRDKTLRRYRTPLGAPVYKWKDPWGREQTSRTHPAFNSGAGYKDDPTASWGDGGGDSGCGGGD